MEAKKISKGDIVEILEPYRDEGDEKLVWVAVDNEEKGRVSITPISSTMSIKPTYVMNVEHIRLKLGELGRQESQG